MSCWVIIGETDGLCMRGDDKKGDLAEGDGEW